MRVVCRSPPGPAYSKPRCVHHGPSMGSGVTFDRCVPIFLRMRAISCRSRQSLARSSPTWTASSEFGPMTATRCLESTKVVAMLTKSSPMLGARNRPIWGDLDRIWATRGGETIVVGGRLLRNLARRHRTRRTRVTWNVVGMNHAYVRSVSRTHAVGVPLSIRVGAGLAETW